MTFKQSICRLIPLAATWCIGRDVEDISRSGLFDPAYYLATVEDTGLTEPDAVHHYCRFGWRQGRNPSPAFDTGHYLKSYPDVVAAGVNPLAHYVRHGRQEGRRVVPAGASASSQWPQAGGVGMRLGKGTAVFLVRQYLLRQWVRKFYAMVKNASASIIYPISPRLHNLLFVRLKLHLKDQYARRHSLSSAEIGADLYPSAVIPPDYGPLVSIIVPNYNHADFLRQRLESVYGQTYRNFEVILLDDASSDSSRAILEGYRERYPDITRCCFSEVNSGSAFNQWRRGFEMARGDLVWIAESDDYCSANLLSELVKYFVDEAVMLAYCRSVFVKGSTDEEVWNIEQYLAELDPDFWRRPFVASAQRLVNKAWAIRNIVPNASSAVFRHPGKMALLDDENWPRMKICGDWMFYLNVVRGGLVAYTPSASNYFRQHQHNTSVRLQDNDIYYSEHEQVASELLRLYRLDDDVLARQREALVSQWRLCRPDRQEKLLDSLYDLSRIQPLSSQRKPNIMMVAFALAAGGGETFPIKLANMLKASGYGVTLLNCHQEPTEPGIRAMLRRDIPLLELACLDALSVVVDDMRIELVHSHHTWADVAVSSLLRNNPNPMVVVTTHGMYETIPPAELDQHMPVLERRVDKVVYTADKNLASFDRTDFYPRRLVRIDNALDIVPVNPISRVELGVPQDAFLICMVSRAIPEKGWQEAIESVRLARQLCSRDIHLLLIGEGPEYDRLRPLVRESCFHFLGFRTNIRDYFAAADMGFLPSRFRGESFPLVIIDCFHSGRPVLASDVGEIGRMIMTPDGPAGMLFSLDKWRIPVPEVARLIAACAQDRDVYMTCLSRVPAAAAKFDAAELLKNYESVYMELFRGNNG